MIFNESDNSITINLRNGAKFICPCHLIQGLQEASLDDLADVYISAAGDSIHWDALNVDMSIPELVAGIFGTKAWMAELGRKGGKKTSASKAEAARKNGQKGGQPKRVV